MFKKKQKKKLSFKGDSRFVYGFGYRETDPYIFYRDGSVVSCFDVLFQYGTNNPADIGWLINLIPQSQISDGTIYFVEREKGMDKSTETDIMQKRLASNLVTISNSKTSDAQQITKNSRRGEDLKQSAQLAGQEDTIVDSDIILIVKAKSPEDVESTISKIKELYRDNDVKGVMLVREIGEQLNTMKTLLTETSADSWHSSDMATTAGTRLFFPSSGFSDKYGEVVGTDVRALISNNPSIIDFSNVRNAVVSMGDVAPFVSIGGYDGGGFMMNGGSAVAQVLSDGNYFSGRRTHHIVLSDFQYQAPDSLYFDMTKEAINPFEVFGTPENVQQDANANFNKATTMMLLAADVTNNPYIKSRLKTLLVDWYIHLANGQGMYTADPEHNPLKAQRILATENHEYYPTPVDFLTELQTNRASSKREGERAIQDSNLLYETMNTLFQTYPNIFKKKTSLPDVFKASDRNIYYDISKLSEDKKIEGVVFLNVLAYVTNRALQGEQIVIHGLDQIDIPLEPIIAYKEKIKRKNIGLITVYEHRKSKINPISFEKFSGQLSQQDMVVLGGITEEDIESYGKSWQQSLPQTVSNQLLSGNRGILYFYRAMDRIGALVDTHLIL